jgi:mono/diheme cytochrome c family protein
MKVGILAATIFGVIAVGAFRATYAADSAARSQQKSASSSSRSVWHGVYTAAQQKRGEKIYVRECSTCHGETLKGGEGSPPLTGADFRAKWNDKTVADLFDNIRLTMPAPPDRPGRLTPQQNIDVLAYVLSVNGFPAGTTTELSTDIEQLKRIRITSERDPSTLR